MTTPIQFGTSCSPNKAWTGDLTTDVPEENNEEKADIDPDRLMQCPYDKNHQIRSCRFSYHLIKCRVNHPKLAKELKTCPFNARHIVPRHELAQHTQTCGDRVIVSDEAGGSNGRSPWHVPVSTWVNPELTENWDKEVDNCVAPFIWGQKSNVQPNVKMSEMNRGLHSRAPNDMPWFKP